MGRANQILVLIDPGHGGRDPGAVAGDVREADINLSVARELVARLALRDIRGVLIRHLDVTLRLTARVNYERLIEPAIYISLHCNAADNSAAAGIEVWTSPGETAADAAASAIHTSLARAFPGRIMRVDYADGDPDKEANFYVLVKTRCPAVLIEMGFLSNPEERAWLVQPNTHHQLAAAIAAGIYNWQKGDQGGFSQRV
jgi:N-acetylmuramoyl-L-alanine amidase